MTGGMDQSDLDWHPKRRIDWTVVIVAVVFVAGVLAYHGTGAMR